MLGGGARGLDGLWGACRMNRLRVQELSRAIEEILEKGTRFVWLIDTLLGSDLAGVAESECERGGRGTDARRGWCRIGRCWIETLENGIGYRRWDIGGVGGEGPARGGREITLANATAAKHESVR